MQTKGAKIAAGVGLGMAIGGMTAAISSSMTRGKTPVKKKAAKAIRSMEDVLDSLQIMLK